MLQGSGRSRRSADMSSPNLARRASRGVRSSTVASPCIARHVQTSSSSSSSSSSNATRTYTLSPFVPDLLPLTDDAANAAEKRRTSLPNATSTSLPAAHTFRRRMHSTGAGTVRAMVSDIEDRQAAAVAAALEEAD
jgi:hypothetical protein